MVSWDDATAFCAWLSKKEGRTYRLPMDHEWSCAVGIGSREDPNAAPDSKIYSVADTFPWGESFPPQGKPVGNYLGSETKGKFHNWETPLENYQDGFVTTAPVGSFPANVFGIYDLGGNVDEWCLEWVNPVRKENRFFRGGAWIFSGAFDLSSSRRFGVAGSSGRGDANGFRVVLALPGSEQPSP